MFARIFKGTVMIGLVSAILIVAKSNLEKLGELAVGVPSVENAQKLVDRVQEAMEVLTDSDQGDWEEFDE
ncbi:MAG: hypothetical protein ABIK62_00555 [candidate division WOR-3 bacterium]